MNFTLTSRVHRELADALAYYRAIRPELSLDFLAAFEEARDSAAEHPLAFRERREGVRVVALRRFPYALRYRVLPSGRAVQILSLRHSARKPE